MRELSLHILDIAQNAIAAGATVIEITAAADTAAHTLAVCIADNGCGMTEEQVQRVLDPFYTTRTTRKVGMGVPLFKMAAEQTGGHLEISSEVGVGTTVNALFHTEHPDCIPLGDMASSIATLLCMNSSRRFIYRHRVDAAEFLLDTDTLHEILGDVPLSDSAVMQWLRAYLQENIEALYGGVT